MRKLIGLSATALMIAALPALAQEATQPQQQAPAQPAATATTTAQQPAATQTTTEQPAAQQPAATTTATQPPAEQPAAATTTAQQPAEQPAAGQQPAQGQNPLTDAIAALQQALDQLQGGGGGAAAGGADATGAGGAAGAEGQPADPNAQAAADQATQQQNVQNVRTALDQFQQAYQQFQSQGNQPAGQADLTPLIDQARTQLDSDPNQAAGTIQQIIDQASQMQGIQQQSQVPAEADSIVGRKIMTSAGEEAGEVGNVLVTADGQVSAVLVTRGGVLGLGEQQVLIPWDQLQLQGDQIMVNMTADQIGALPEYATD